MNIDKKLIRNTLWDAVSEKLGVNYVGVLEVNWLGLGAGAIEKSYVCDFIESALNLKIPNDIIYESHCPGDIADYLIANYAEDPKEAPEDKKDINEQKKTYSLVAEMYAIVARIEGMKAKNMFCGEDECFYNEDAFLVCQQRLEAISGDLRS